MMKLLFFIFLLTISFIASGAEVFITSPQNGYILRDQQGKLDLEGYVLFAPGEDTTGNMGKVVCGDKQGPVKPNSYTWKIQNLKLNLEGYNVITCSYVRGNQANTKSITVLWSKSNIAPTAQYSFTPQSGRAPLNVSFDASQSKDPDGSIVFYSWNFGDGTTANGKNVSHTFTTSGNYGITLTVLDNENTFSSVTKYIFVDIPSQIPVAQIAANPVTGEIPLSVSFDASLSNDPDGGSLKEYHFDFGDGSQEITTLPFITHVYQGDGSYTASLVVKDTEDELSAPVSINIQSFRPNIPPVAQIDSSTISGYPPLEVSFSGARSSDADGTIESYTWYFPNGVIKTGVEVTHVFEQSGTFEVTLVVKDNRNVPVESKVSINVDSDEAGPVLAVTPENNSFIRTGTPQFEISHTDSTSGIDLSSIKAYLDGNDISARLQVGNESSILAFTLANPISTGFHELRFEVKDKAGNLSVLVNNYHVDLGEISVSYIRGTVLDIDNNPIEGVSIADIYTAPNVKINVSTDAQGHYKIPFQQAGTYRLSFNKSGFTESVRTITPTIVEDIDLGLVYLAEADSLITPVVAAAGGTAQNSTGSMSFVFPPGVLPFDVEVTMTEFIDERTMPGPLPVMSMFTYAFDTRPQGVLLNGEATLNLDNSLGFPVGTPIVYGVFDRQLGRWLDSGKTVIVGSNKDGAMPIPADDFPLGDPNLPGSCGSDGCQPPKGASGGGGGPCTAKCCDVGAGGGPGSGGGPGAGPGFPGGSPGKGPTPNLGGGGPGTDITLSGTVNSCAIDSKTGDLSIEHEINKVASSADNFDLNFAYHSTQVEPQFFVDTVVSTKDTEPPVKVRSDISIAGNSFRRTYEGNNFPFDTVFRALFPAKNAEGNYFPTGTYQYTHAISTSFNSQYATAAYFGGPPASLLDVITRVPISFSSIVTDRSVVINRRLSPFGNGWGLEKLDQLHTSNDGVVLWENGGRGYTYFLPVGDTSKINKIISKTKKGISPNLNSVTSINGVFYGTDCENNYVYRFSLNGNIEIIAGNGYPGNKGDGKDALDAQLNCPVAISPAELGGFYIADSGNYSIRKIGIDGKIHTLVGNLPAKPLSVAEDKMRAVYFTTDNSLMLLTPRGELQTYSSIDTGYVKADLKKPTQIFFNHEDYPMVVDSENGRIITFYPQGRTFQKNFNGFDKKLGYQVKPVQVVTDPIRKIFYILDAKGKVYSWNGLGDGKLIELNFSSNRGLYQKTNDSSESLKILSLAYTPEQGFAFITKDKELFLTTIKKSENELNYISRAGNLDILRKKPDGTFELKSPDNTVKTFSSDGKLTSVKTANNRIRTYLYNESGLISKINFVGGFFDFLYDSRGYLTSVRDSANRITNFEINEKGQLVRIESPNGSEKFFEYDTNHLLKTEIDEDGKSKQFFYERGKIIKEILPGGRERFFYPEHLKDNQYPTSDAPVEGIPTRPNDLFTKITSPGGTCELKAVFEKGVAVSLTDCLGNVLQNKINENGKITRTTTPEGRTFSYGYNSQGKMVSENSSAGIFTYEYSEQNGKLVRVTDFFNNSKRFEYNLKGLISKVTDEDNYSTSFEYDELGNLIEVTDPYENSVLLNYDENSNLSKLVDQKGAITEYYRDMAGNLISIKDPENKITQFEYDEDDNLTAIYDALNNITSFTYTPSGKISSITDAKENKTSFVYHPYFQGVTEVIKPDSSLEKFSYDNEERIKHKSNADGSVVAFAYDSNGKVILKTTETSSTSYAYDKDGLITNIANNFSELNIQYNDKTKIDSLSSTHAPGEISYSYDERGLKSKSIYKIGNKTIFAINYTYNNRKLITGIHADLSGLTVDWNRTWDELDRPSLDVVSNGLSVRRSYDPAGRLTYLSNELSESSPIDRFEYDYTLVGNISRREKTFTRINQGSIGSISESFAYDNLHRVTETSYSGNFEYDQVGNQVQNGGIYNSLNELISDSNYNYTYNENGSLIQKTSKIKNEITKYSWDSENHLTSIKSYKDGFLIDDVSYKYDGLDRRIEKKVNNSITKFSYDNEDLVLEFGENNQVAAIYLHGPDIDDPIAMARDINNDGNFTENELFFYSKDILNSVHSILDINGKVVQRYNYTAYGETKVDKLSSNSRLIKSPYGFTGREWEQETGDYYYRARYYDPRTSRFLSLDPMSFASGIVNHYTYSHRPFNESDPSGNIGAAVAVGGVGAAIGAVVGFNGSSATCLKGKVIDAAYGAAVGFASGFFAGVGAGFWRVGFSWAAVAPEGGTVVGGIAGAIGGVGIGAGIEALGQFGLDGSKFCKPKKPKQPKEPKCE